MNGLSTFEITINLTKKGIQNYEAVIEAYYQYIHKIKEVGPQEFYFQEQKDIGAMNFQFADKKDGIDQAVSFTRKIPQHTEENIDQLIRSGYIRDEFDQDQIKKYIDVLSRTDTLNVIIRSKTFEGQTDQVAEWYLTKYKVEPFSPELLKKMQSPSCVIKDKKLDYPPSNNLIAKDFGILEKSDNQKPKLLKRWPKCTDLWYLKDNKFERPKLIVNMNVYTNDCLWSQKPESRVYALLWQKVLQEYMREFNYNAEEARLDFSISVLDDHIKFKWSGYNDAMPQYIDETLARIVQMQD